MSALDTYLKQYYLAKDAFAKHCGVPTQRLDDLIEKRAVPRATYIVEGDRIFSLAFGSIQTERSRPGEYFHPAQKRWVALAHGAPPESEAKTVQETFFLNFGVSWPTTMAKPSDYRTRLTTMAMKFLAG